MSMKGLRAARVVMLGALVAEANRQERRGDEYAAGMIRAEARGLADQWDIQISEVEGLARE